MGMSITTTSGTIETQSPLHDANASVPSGETQRMPRVIVSEFPEPEPTFQQPYYEGHEHHADHQPHAEPELPSMPSAEPPSPMAQTLAQAHRLMLAGRPERAARRYWDVCRMYSERGEAMQAMAIAFQAIRADPSAASPTLVAPLVEPLGPQGYPLALRAAELYVELGLLEEAWHMYAAAASVMSQPAEAYEGIASVALAIGWISEGVTALLFASDAYAQRSNIHRARALLDEAATISPDRPDVRARQGYSRTRAS